MMKAGSPKKAKVEYAKDAKSQFKVGSKAFGRAWGAATAEADAPKWSKPGRKS